MVILGALFVISFAIESKEGETGITTEVPALSNEPEGLALTTAVRSILLATAANTAAKGNIVLFAGTGEIQRAILPGFSLILAANLLALLLI